MPVRPRLAKYFSRGLGAFATGFWRWKAIDQRGPMFHRRANSGNESGNSGKDLSIYRPENRDAAGITVCTPAAEAQSPKICSDVGIFVGMPPKPNQ
jgi:hypothetical protein